MIFMNEIKQIDPSKTLKQSNSLVVARYRLSKYEQRMIIAICSQLNKNADEFETVRVRAKDLADFCKFKGEDAYRKVHSTILKLMSRTLQIQKNDGKWYITHWLQSAEHIDGGLIEYCIDQRLKPELLQLKSAYLSTSAEPLMNFKRDYAARLYFILKKLVRLREYTYDLDFFRDRFQLGKTYQKISNLKNWVLEPALKEINEKSDISVWHEYIKEGRSYKKIHFIVDVKSEKKEINNPAPADAEQLPQLTSSPVVTAETAETTDHSAGTALLKSLGINPPSASATADFKKKEESALAPAEEKNKIASADGGEDSKLTAEQQADYDRLIKYEIWAKTAKKFVIAYDHERIERNIKGCTKSKSKGNIRDFGAVLADAIANDTYQGEAEEQTKAIEREKAREEQKAINKAKTEEMAKIREQYTPDKLNAIMAEVKNEYDKSGVMTEEMQYKLNKYGITVLQFYLFRTQNYIIGDKSEKAVKKEDIKIDFEIDLDDEKSVEKIIKAYYKNGKKCPDKILQKLNQIGYNWNDFASKNIGKILYCW